MRKRGERAVVVVEEGGGGGRERRAEKKRKKNENEKKTKTKKTLGVGPISLPFFRASVPLLLFGGLFSLQRARARRSQGHARDPSLWRVSRSAEETGAGRKEAVKEIRGDSEEHRVFVGAPTPSQLNRQHKKERGQRTVFSFSTVVLSTGNERT